MSDTDPYEREAAKAAIKVLQRELAESKDKIEELVQTGLKQMDKERSLKRELAEAREQRDTLVEALHSIRHRLGDFKEPWNSRETYIDTIAHQALAAVKGGSHE